jgi:hypothetical protein
MCNALSRRQSWLNDFLRPYFHAANNFVINAIAVWIAGHHSGNRRATAVKKAQPRNTTTT